MIERIERLINATGQAIGLVLHDAVDIVWWWLPVAILLQVLSQVVRNRAWWHIICAAYPNTDLKWWDVVRAYFGGAGLNAVIPARGGDVVKLAIVHRKIPGATYTTLVGTFVPETLFETLCGIGLVIWALGNGWLPVPTSPSEIPELDVSFVAHHPILSAFIVGGLIVIGFFVFRWVHRNAHILIERIKQGMAIFGDPWRFVREVVTWQALGRVIRLASLACFMAAFRLPVTISTAILVMAAQGGGRIIPFAPASAGIRLAMLSYGLIEITGDPVDIANITAFTVMTGFIFLLVGLAISIVICLREFGTLSPRKALATAKTVVVEGARAVREPPEPSVT